MQAAFFYRDEKSPLSSSYRIGDVLNSAFVNSVCMGSEMGRLNTLEARISRSRAGCEKEDSLLTSGTSNSFLQETSTVVLSLSFQVNEYRALFSLQAARASSFSSCSLIDAYSSAVTLSTYIVLF